MINVRLPSALDGSSRARAAKIALREKSTKRNNLRRLAKAPVGTSKMFVADMGNSAIDGNSTVFDSKCLKIVLTARQRLGLRAITSSLTNKVFRAHSCAMTHVTGADRKSV